jgi:hypothetical protein
LRRRKLVASPGSPGVHLPATADLASLLPSLSPSDHLLEKSPVPFVARGTLYRLDEPTVMLRILLAVFLYLPARATDFFSAAWSSG